MQHIHFIAIGGSAMHNLAIALHRKGYHVTGSDDEIFDPALSRLSHEGLAPEEFGWFPEKLGSHIDAIVLGMHARADNPELLRARELGLRIYSYPEFLYEQSLDKKRVVIGGSHGKTTITAMILHVLERAGKEFDYMVGAQLDGFDVMVKLSETAPVMIFEGDEYLTSALDPRPKFHVYQPDIALISGIAWDHMNVFRTFDSYVEQFRIFARMVPAKGAVIYCREENILDEMMQTSGVAAEAIPYGIPCYHIRNGVTFIETATGEIPLKIFGKHNLMNIEGARNICNLLGVDDLQFYAAIGSFSGARNRLELLAAGASTAVYRDFAHAPSKLKATINAAREQYPDRHLVACFELHTYSSLNKDFLGQYRGSMMEADTAIVFFSEHALELKKLPMLDAAGIEAAFDKKGMQVFTGKDQLQSYLLSLPWKGRNLLLMSSGNYNGLDTAALAEHIARS